MIAEGPEALGELVDVILHESVHATLYIKGQSSFDESLASFVAEKMTIQYLEKTRGPHSSEEQAYIKTEDQSRKIQKKFHEAYVQLSKLYSLPASEKSDGEKLREKQAILAALKAELKYRRDINNATLIQYRTYNTSREDFEKLFKACGSNWQNFLNTLKTLTPSSFQKPQQEDLSPVLGVLVQNGCRGLTPDS